MKNLYSTFKKSLLLAACIVFCANADVLAQVPQFYNFNAGTSTNVFPLGTTSSNKVQWIYGPSVFNSMGTLGGTPAFPGNITTIYFRTGSTNTPNYSDFTISLGQTVGTQTTWTTPVYQTGLTQCFYQSPYTFTGPTVGGWYAINLQTPFLYDPTQSLVFEMKQSGYTGSGSSVRQNSAGGSTRIWGGFGATSGSSGSGLVDFGFDIIPATPCTGQPTAGTITPSNPSVCTGQSLTMSLSGVTLAGNMLYQWQQSTNGGVTWSNSPGTSTNLSYTTPNLTTTTMYRFIILCTPSGLADTSAPSTVTVAPPSYAALPYVQDFETWANYCGISDVPSDFHWSNNPLTGNDSWRRHDQGGLGAWTNPQLGMYSPAASSGSHSARFHSYYGSGTGNLDMYVDCSTVTGNKTLAFDYINNNSTSGSDFIQIEFSTNGGMFFIPLASFNSSPTWQTQFVTIPSNSATTIVRFSASGGSNFVAASDIGIDNVNLLAPCTGQPNAGIIDSITPCPNQAFNLTITGSTSAGGLTYNWESAPSATGPWTALGASAGPTFNTTIAAPTFFRCVVTCTASGLSDTTAARYVGLGSFWVCYCPSQATIVNFENIGNVLLEDTSGLNPALINNGNPLPQTNNPTSTNLYSNFTTLAPPTLFQDSAYDLTITGIAFDAFFSSSFTATYIDFNRDGVYDPLNERVMANQISSGTNQQATTQFTVPNNTQFGLTGMRVVFQVFGSATTISPCGTYNYGETEDYVVNLAPSPCISPPNAGFATTTDTATCPGTAVVLTNTTYDKIFANLTSSWQLSTDGINYADVPGGNIDTLNINPTVDSWYRFRVTCNGTSTSYSNIIKISMLPPGSCFGLSATTGTINDSSDIGGFVLSTPQPTNINLYTYTAGGPHLSNPAATRFYTNYTPTGIIDMYTDSTYKVSIYHILRTANHGDAKVTMFIDYNNNFTFDLPQELVFSGLADVNNYFLNGEIVTPVAPAINVPTAMRIVLNNDVGPNAASDTGFGTYVSGETEDFFVQFKPNIVTSVDNISDLENVSIYPNPTSGDVYVGLKALHNTNVNLEVVSVTGAKILTKQIKNVAGNYSTVLDLSKVASGVYLLKVATENGSFVKRITVE